MEFVTILGLSRRIKCKKVLTIKIISLIFKSYQNLTKSEEGTLILKSSQTLKNKQTRTLLLEILSNEVSILIICPHMYIY